MAEMPHDSHAAPVDPNVAPAHLDVKASFTAFQVGVCWSLGIIAIASGVVFGLTLANK